MEQWAAGRFNDPDPQVCTTANVSAVSQLRAFQEIADIEAEELNEGETSEG